MSRRYPVAFAQENGWSEWHRLRRGYQMACCDCGLVHRFEHMVARRSRAKAKPGYAVTGERVRDAVVLFRVQRNNRATAQLRRHRH